MKLLIVDDHPLVRRGIIDCLSMNKSIEEIREADTIQNALKILRSNPIDIVVVDLHLGIEDGFDLIEQARKVKKDAKYVILTSSSRLVDFQRAKQLDIDAFILKDAFVEDFLYAIHVVNRGDKYYSPRFMEETMNGFVPRELDSLTDREREVLEQLIKGRSNAQISDTLFITEGTAKKHISNILTKLNLNSRIDAILYAKKIYGD